MAIYCHLPGFYVLVNSLMDGFCASYCVTTSVHKKIQSMKAASDKPTLVVRSKVG